jgi:transposase-like protein
MKTDFANLTEFILHFKDEDTCRKYFESVRFANGDYCPHCKHEKIHRYSNGKRYRCASCKQDFTIKTGTLFGESKLPLQKWFIAIYLLTTHKKGISSIQLAKHVGVTQKTAWFMDMRIREALKQNNGKLFGTVEVDETYIGGKHKRKYGFSKKAAVMGMIERGGTAKAFHIEARQTHIMLGKIRENIDPLAHIMTDEARVYTKLPKLGYQRGAIKHGKKHWVRGNVHTNTIESFWALFKRGTVGTYHIMSKKHLQRYIDEFVYRFNNRLQESGDVFVDVMNRMSENDKMSYKTLIT